MSDDMTPIRIPATIVHRTSMLDFLPGQVAGALLQIGMSDAEMVAVRTRVICEAIVEEMKTSPHWMPSVTIFPNKYPVLTLEQAKSAGKCRICGKLSGTEIVITNDGKEHAHETCLAKYRNEESTP